MLAQLDCAMTALLHLQVLHEAQPKPSDVPGPHPYPFQLAIRDALIGTEFASLLQEFHFEPQRDAFMLDIVGNTVCADLLDYARRDSHYAGLRLDFDSDRIAENFTVVAVDASNYEIHHPNPEEARDGTIDSPHKLTSPFEGWCLRSAISLFSHKYRTDIPSELMNLLNVRFYIYERVIFHPTKCAAGSMLGTALQLLGWKGNQDKGSDLPDQLRFVGDDVFLHDIRSALGLLLKFLSALPEHHEITLDDVASLKAADQGHNGLTSLLLRLRVKQTTQHATTELSAAQMLLNRLTSRRFFRPIFRALPNSNNPILQAGPEALAKLFRDPEIRYGAERLIEHDAGLDLGTITIHCPKRNTAQKIANVFLTKPDANGEDQVCKLKDIHSLDDPIFRDHESAVTAVEKMYKSMWRLVVYVAPEYVDKYHDICKTAAKVISQTIDVHKHSTGKNSGWPNDATLEPELKVKAAAPRGSYVSDDSDLSPLGEMLGEIGEEISNSSVINCITSDFSTSPEGISAEARARVKEAILAALATETVSSAEPESTTKTRDVEVEETISVTRTDHVITIVKGYFPMPKLKDIERLRSRFAPRLDSLSQSQYDNVASKIETAVRQSELVDARGADHKGLSTFREFEELLEKLLDNAAGLFEEGE